MVNRVKAIEILEKEIAKDKRKLKTERTRCDYELRKYRINMMQKRLDYLRTMDDG